MNLILLDDDLLYQTEKIKALFEERNDCRVCSLKESLSADFPPDTPVRGVILTTLRSGWMKYHSQIADRYPFVAHWVFCVTDMNGDALRRTAANQFMGLPDSNAYCQLIFDNSESFSYLFQTLSAPIKINKKCLVVSLNADLASDVKAVLREYIPDWEVESSSDSKPDYTLCDSVLVVGNTMEEMLVAKPEIQSIKVCFWMNEPYFKNHTEIAVEKMLLGSTMNEAGWDIGDYTPLVFFSSLHHEQVYQQLCQEKITTAALLSDPLFVLWDEYGLPLVQSGLKEQTFLSFFDAHTVFKNITDCFCANKNGRIAK